MQYSGDVTDTVRIMIVEPHRDIRALQEAVVKRALAGLTLELVEVASPAEAIEPFGSDPFHLLLIDVTKQSDALKQVINLSRSRQRCPTIAFTTGRVDRATLELLAKDHVFSIFPKPFDPSDVANAIAESFEAQAKSVDAVISPILHGILKHLHFDRRD